MPSVQQILKLDPGDEVKVGIINGAMGQASVAQTSPEVVLECQHWVQPLPTAQVYLVLAMPRPKVCLNICTATCMMLNVHQVSLARTTFH